MRFPAYWPMHSFRPLLHLGGALLLLGSLAYWNWRLHSPAPLPQPETLSVLAPDPSVGVQLASWLAAGDVQLDIKVLGVIHSAPRSVALLRINGASPQPFVAPELLLDSVQLLAVTADGIVISHAGKRQVINASAHNTTDASEIVLPASTLAADSSATD